MNLLYELNYTLRVLKKKLGFSFLCVIVIALGYLITLPLYTIVKTFAYTTLPYPDGDRLVIARHIDARTGSNSAIAPGFDAFLVEAIKDRSSSFEKLGAYYDTPVSLSDGELSAQYFANHLSAEMLGFSSTEPILGRSLLPLDEGQNAVPVVLLGYEVWQNYYAADPDIIGRTARINAQMKTIIGVMPEGFRYPFNAELWLPLHVAIGSEPGTQEGLNLAGVLNRGVTNEEASTELHLLMQGLAAEHPEFYRHSSAMTLPFTQVGMNNAGFIFASMLGIALSLFLVICINVGNLLIVRANERVNELAIRSAMGAKRTSLISHVLLESLIVCLVGAVLGIAASAWLLNTMQAALSSMFFGGRLMAFWWDFSFSGNLLLMSVAMILALWLLSGFYAAWRASKDDLANVLASNSQTVVSQKGGSITRGLVLMQMVMSFFLLVLSGVLVFSFQGLMPTSSIANPENYIRAAINLEDSEYSKPNLNFQYRLQLKQRLIQLDELESVAFATVAPGESSSIERITSENNDVNAEDAPRFGLSAVDRDYFQTIDFPLLEGRFFDSGDTIDSEKVVIVTESFASRVFMEGSPLGQRIQLNDRDGTPGDRLRIVGIVPLTNNDGAPANQSGFSYVYLALSQQQSINRLALVASLNTGIDTTVAELEQLIRRNVSAVDRDVPLYDFSLLSLPIELNAGTLKVVIGMFAASAVAALLLSVISIYGLVARSVYARTSEIGIRRAIGSSDIAISKIFLAQSFIYVSVAVVIGGGVGALVINLIDASISSVGSLASVFNLLQLLTLVFPVVTIVVICLVFCASYLPVRRVVAMEPGEALHYE